MRVNFLNFIPLLFAVFLLSFLYISLQYPTQAKAPSLEGTVLSAFELPSERERVSFSSKELRGEWVLLNVWATWCSACIAEHEALMNISKSIPVYGISYRDDRKSVELWLKKYGNPYRKTGLDEAGQTAIELGVLGTPETFLIDPEGRIRYRHTGVLTEEEWKKYFVPIVRGKQ